MNHLIRVCQIGLSFLVIQLTLKLLGSEPYIALNKAIFVYLVALSISQVNYNMVWRRESVVIYDLLFFSIVSTLVSLVLSFDYDVLWVVPLYVMGRLLERYAYCNLLASGRFFFGQFYLLGLYILEFAGLLLLSSWNLSIPDTTHSRLMLVFMLYSFLSICILYFYNVTRVEVEGKGILAYFISCAYDFKILVYFVFSVIILNIDRILSGSLESGSEEYLFTLAVAGSVFSISSIEIDRLKSSVASGKEESARNVFLYILVFPLAGLAYWYFISYLEFLRTFFALGNVLLFESLGIFCLYGAVFGLMYKSTPHLIRGGITLSVIYLIFGLLVKFFSYHFFGVVYSNFIAAAFLMVGCVILVRRDAIFSRMS